MFDANNIQQYYFRAQPNDNYQFISNKNTYKKFYPKTIKMAQNPEKQEVLKRDQCYNSYGNHIKIVGQPIIPTKIEANTNNRLNDLSYINQGSGHKMKQNAQFQFEKNTELEANEKNVLQDQQRQNKTKMKQNQFQQLLNQGHLIDWSTQKEKLEHQIKQKPDGGSKQQQQIAHQRSFKNQGLPNGRNVCYLNSIIQSLYGACCFRQRIIEIHEKMQEDFENHSLISNLANIFLTLQKGLDSRYKKQYLLQFIYILKQKGLQFKDFAQEDARQFFFNILAPLLEEQATLESEFFKVTYQQSCSSCDQKSVIEQRYYIDGIDYCCKCKAKVDKFLIDTPKYLVIAKSSKMLQIQYEIQTQNGQSIAKYQCVSCIEYCGSGYSGHYLAFRIIQQGKWASFNDQYAKQQCVEKIFYSTNIIMGIYELKSFKQQIDKEKRLPIFTSPTQFNDKQIQSQKQKQIRNASAGLQQCPQLDFYKFKGYFPHLYIDENQQLKKGKVYRCLINILFKKQQSNKFSKRQIFFQIPEPSYKQNALEYINLHNYKQFFYCKTNILRVQCANDILKNGKINLKKTLQTIEVYLIQKAEQSFNQIGPKQFIRKLNDTLNNYKHQYYFQVISRFPKQYQYEELYTKSQSHFSKQINPFILFKIGNAYKIVIKCIGQDSDRIVAKDQQVLFTVAFFNIDQKLRKKYLVYLIDLEKRFFYSEPGFIYSPQSQTLQDVCKFLQNKLQQAAIKAIQKCRYDFLKQAKNNKNFNLRSVTNQFDFGNKKKTILKNQEEVQN